MPNCNQVKLSDPCFEVVGFYPLCLMLLNIITIIFGSPSTTGIQIGTKTDNVAQFWGFQTPSHPSIINITPDPFALVLHLGQPPPSLIVLPN